MCEWKAADDHAGNHDPFDGNGIKRGDRGGAGGISAGGNRRHGMGDGVEIAHPGERQHDRPACCQAGIDKAYAAGKLRRTRHHLVGGVKGFGSEKLHPADRQHRQNGHRHDDDADPAEPLQQRAPDQDAGRCHLDLLKDCRAGRRDAGHGFEHGVRKAQIQFAEHEGERPEDSDRNPRAIRQKEGLPQPEVEAVALRGGKPDGHPDKRRQKRRQGEDLPVGRAEIQVETHRDQHCRRENRGQQAEDVQDR